MDTEYRVYKEIGQRIKRMREQLGLSQEELSDRMDYRSAATISHFESGARKISITDLQKLSAIFGVPLESFVSEEKKKKKEDLQHFRLRAKFVRPDAQDVVAEFLSFAQTHAERPNHLTLTSMEIQKPGLAAEKVLHFVEWREPPVSSREVAKRLGLPVFDWDFPNEVSGIFVPTGSGACIGVNRNHSNVRQNFTVAHETAHWLYHNPKIQIDFLQTEMLVSSDEQYDLEERKANQFAADLLMPKAWIKRDFNIPQDLPMLANRYQVSEQALWYRLVTLKLVPA